MKLGRFSQQWSGRFFDRRPRWGLTLLGKGCLALFLSSLLLCLGLGLGPKVYPFFAMNAPIASADLLIVEGWITDANVQDAVQEFRSRPYQAIVTTGTQLPQGYYLSEYKTFADLSRASLIKIGLDPQQVIAVPAPGVPRNRSYTSAVAVNHWLTQWNQSESAKQRDRVSSQSSQLPSSTASFKLQGEIRSANLLSEGPHARRSWMLYQKALQGKIQLGVIAAPPQEYQAERWWTQSEGFKRVLFEAIGWFYVQVFNQIE